MTTAVAVQNEAPQLRSFLEKYKGKIAEAAANKVDADRMLRVALIAATKTPKLLECEPATVLQCLIQAASLGLEAGSALGEAYLVPYKKDCTLIIGYRGFISLARRSGSIRGVEARPVFEGEHFRVKYGTEPGIEHEPVFDKPRTYREFTAVYAVWKLDDGSKDGSVQFDVMSKAEVDAIRARSKASGEGPWSTDYIEMAKKTVLRRSAKLVPMSVDLVEALDRDAENEFGDLRVGLSADVSTTPTLSASERLKAKIGAGVPVNDPAAKIDALKARRDAGELLSEDQLDDIRLWDMEHPGPGQ